MPRLAVSVLVLLDSLSQVAGSADVAGTVLDEECVDAGIRRRFSVNDRDRGAVDQFGVEALNVAQSRTDVVVAFGPPHIRRTGFR